MKKLNLNVANLGATEILTREELKKVLGGTGTGTGSGVEIKCAASKDMMGAITWWGDNSADAIEYAGANGFWCCNCQEEKDNCPLV